MLVFFQDLEGLTEVFGGTSAGMSGPKLSLWAEFSFLSKVCICDRKKLEFKGASVSVLREFLPTFPQICLCNENKTFSQHDSVSVIEAIDPRTNVCLY